MSRAGAVALWLHALAPGGTAVAEEGVFWRLESAERKTSHLLGTIHLDDARVLALAPAVREALQASDSLCVEIVLGAEDVAQLRRLMSLPSGESLRELLPQGTWQAIVPAMRDRSVSTDRLERMRPWAVVMTLSVPPAVDGPVQDVYLQQLASAAGIPVHALESLTEQADALGGLALADQLALLDATLQQLPQLDTTVQAMIEAWLDGDLAILAELAAPPVDIAAGLHQRLRQRLLTNRNEVMLARMLPKLRKGNAFVAVGALHLPGDDGLLALLRGQGFKLTAVR